MNDSKDKINISHRSTILIKKVWTNSCCTLAKSINEVKVPKLEFMKYKHNCVNYELWLMPITCQAWMACEIVFGTYVPMMIKIMIELWKNDT